MLLGNIKNNCYLAMNRLFQLDNVIYTSHIAGISDNSYINMGVQSVNYVLSVLKGKPIDVDSVVNKSIL